jgi:single-stranded-DNA-specific exonuclease
MENKNKIWTIPETLPVEVEKALGIFPHAFRQILFNRGVTSIDEATNFLSASTYPEYSPDLMLGIIAAIDRINFSLKNDKKIIVYGDYDVDGVTATVLLTQVLQSLGADVDGYIPNRFDEGYGLNNEALENLKNSGVDLVITVDCGIRSLNEAFFAKNQGLDLVITDHHHPGHELPQAFAIVNPKQPGCPYPEKDLSGVGLAYKLACAILVDHFNDPTDRQYENSVLDLVALGTVADIVPLKGENRSLVRKGLNEIRIPRRQGLCSLIGASGLRAENINASDISFILAPRLNAAGRLESAIDAYNLLKTNDVMEAGRLAQKLDNQNRERQALTQTTLEQAIIQIFERDPNPLIMIAIDPSFNKGIVGLTASRIVEQFYRPAIIAQIGETFTRGSCRSISEFHITNALDEVADLLDHHGGHAAAAGFTILNENLDQFLDRLQGIAQRELAHLDLRPTLKADLEIELSELKPDLLPYIDLLQPTGIGNPSALFISRNVRVRSFRSIGRENSHLKLTVTDGRIIFDAIAFRMGHLIDTLPEKIDILFSFEKNIYNDRVSLQLNIKDIKPANTNH